MQCPFWRWPLAWSRVCNLDLLWFCERLTNPRCRVQLSSNVTCLTLAASGSVRTDFVDFAHKFVAKVQKGMQKAKEQKRKNHYSSTELGAELLKRQAEVKDKGTESLEKYLNGIAKDTHATAWLATMYSRYFGYQRCCIDPLHSQSGDLYTERKVKDKENICIVTTRIVDKLYPHWGAYSSLIFNALRGTSTMWVVRLTLMVRVQKLGSKPLISKI